MNILVVRNDKIGDFITALPTCYILKQQFPGCHITVLISPINQSIAKACPFIDNILTDNGQSTTELAQMLRQYQFDISFTLFSNTRVAIAQWLARIPQRYAPATKIAQVFYNRRIKQRRSQVKMAEFEYNIALVQAAYPDISTNYPKPLLTFNQQEVQAIYQNFCKTLNVNKPVIAFHPGFGGSSDANWDISEYIELANSIAHHPNIEIVFTFGPGDEAFYDVFLQAKSGFKSHFFQGEVLAFAKLVSRFKLFVSTSTGTFHLASAVGTPTMTFFADTLFASAKRWKGIGDAALQHHYMIPAEHQARQAMFQQVKKDLTQLIQADDSAHAASSI